MLDPDEAKPRRIGFPRRGLTPFLLLAGMTIALAPAAWANHQFTDVPTSSPHHDDIGTIARAGVTGGCAPGLYCPTQNVTRQQMGSFLARTLRNLTPVVRTASAAPGAVDPDADPVLCQTQDFTPNVDVRAFVHGFVALQQDADGLLGWQVQAVRSTDGGTSWFHVGGFTNHATGRLQGDFSNASHIAEELRFAGESVRYGLRVARRAGTVDAFFSTCATEAVFTYADAGASALGS